MSINSKNKGCRFERWVGHYGQEHGLDSRRGQQFAGGPDSPDVIGYPGLHIEAKHNERLNVYDAMDQAIRDSGGKNKPTVIWKKNYKPVLVTMQIDDWWELYEAWLKDECLQKK